MEIGIEDKLNIENNHIIKGIIGDEKIFFSDRLIKKNASFFSKSQDRIIIITNKAVYNFNENDMKRRIRIEDIIGITISRFSDQFIIHGNYNEYDYLLIYGNRKKLIKILQILHVSLTNKDLLFCKKKEKDLSEFMVTKDERNKKTNIFKIDYSELTSIKDYLKNDNINEGVGQNPLFQRRKTIQIPFKKPDYSYKIKKESNKIKDDNPISNKILNKDINSNEELIKQLNEEKNKNKQLLEELNKERKKVVELTNKIKLLEENNNKIKKINELEELIKEKDKELKDLKSKIEKNDLVPTLNPGEEVIAVNFTSCEMDINCPMPCKKNTLLSRLEEKLYNDYPRYKDFPTYLTVNGTIVSRFKTLEENGIKNKNSILVNKYDG